MARPARNLLAGAAVAVVVAVLVAAPTFGSVSAWKWLLGLVGLYLWFLAERTKPPRS
jgi:hypothetical protein